MLFQTLDINLKKTTFHASIVTIHKKCRTISDIIKSLISFVDLDFTDLDILCKYNLEDLKIGRSKQSYFYLL